MLTRRIDTPTRFTRSDVPRLVIAAGILILALAAILGADILPDQPLDAAEGQLATRDIVAPKAIDFESKVQTDQARAAASAAVPFQYSFTTENAIAIAAAQQLAFESRVNGIDTTFAADRYPGGRQEGPAQERRARPSDPAKATLVALDAARWAVVRTEAARVLDATERTELRDTEVDETRTRLSGRMAGGLDEAERMLAAELIAPLVVPNSSLSLPLTTTARAAAAADVQPVRVTIRQGEVIVRNGSPFAATDIEKIDALGLRQALPDFTSFGGWALLAVLVVGMLLAWIWRFRPGLWHRDNVLILIGLLVVGATLALKITAGRPTLPFFLPTAAIAMLLAILLDASLATMVIAIVALIGGAVNGGSLEFTAYIFLGGLAGMIAVRRGDRLQVFVQASLAVFVVNALVVSVFSLLGARDLRGDPRAVVRVGRVGGRVGHRRRRHVRGARLGVRDPDRLPAARAGEPVAAAAAPAPGRDARDVPPLADGRQPRRAGRRGDRRRSAGDPRGGLLPRRRQAREPARVHREPGRRREHPRPARSRGQRRDPQAARRRRDRPGLQGDACRRRSSPTSRSTTGRRS